MRQSSKDAIKQLGNHAIKRRFAGPLNGMIKNSSECAGSLGKMAINVAAQV
jgi:hypothetical protein